MMHKYKPIMYDVSMQVTSDFPYFHPVSCEASENSKSAFSASLRFEVVLDIFVTEKSKAKDDILLQFLYALSRVSESKSKNQIKNFRIQD